MIDEKEPEKSCIYRLKKNADMTNNCVLWTDLVPHAGAAGTLFRSICPALPCQEILQSISAEILVSLPVRKEKYFDLMRKNVCVYDNAIFSTV